MTFCIVEFSSAYATCLVRKVCGVVRSPWGTSLGEDNLGARDRVLNTKVAHRACSGHVPGKHSPLCKVLPLHILHCVPLRFRPSWLPAGITVTYTQSNGDRGAATLISASKCGQHVSTESPRNQGMAFPPQSAPRRYTVCARCACGASTPPKSHPTPRYPPPLAQGRP